ncbi:LPXTG cell wall anchor domain-containing protein [Leuconostoc pseudomesenteroides]
MNAAGILPSTGENNNLGTITAIAGLGLITASVATKKTKKNKHQE